MFFYVLTIFCDTVGLEHGNETVLMSSILMGDWITKLCIFVTTEIGKENENYSRTVDRCR